MSRLLLHVEGQTEETFVNDVLAPHLRDRGYDSVRARLVGNARQRDRRGGIRDWNAVRRDIANHLREDAGAFATTMVDYYGLPRSGQRAWPGRARASTLPFAEKADAVEAELLADIGREMGGGFRRNRFVPYVMMHEFEALLFSDCVLFGRGIGRPDLAASFQGIRDQFATSRRRSGPRRCVRRAQWLPTHRWYAVNSFGRRSACLRLRRSLRARWRRTRPGSDETDMLVRSMEQGRDLAATLGSNTCVLMRGHGAVVAANSLKEAVMTAIYLKLNAEVQLQAMAIGTPRGLSDREVELSRATQFSPLALDRAWEYFCLRAGVDPV